MSQTGKRLRYLLPMCGLLIACAVPLAAQGGSIRGKLILPAGDNFNEATRISLETSRGVRAIVYTDNRGQFQFFGLAPGVYQVVIEGDRLRFETTTASIEVFPNAPALLNIVLKERKDPTRSKGGGKAVSAGELDAAVPEKAKKEFEQASNSSKEGKADDAIAHLRKAIELYPAYLMARNDLGVQLLSQGKLDEASVELKKAVALDAKAFNPKLNLGIVQVSQQNYSEAADTLRRALSLESNSPAVRLYLGKALLGLHDPSAAETEFKAAHDLGGTTFALALYHLGHIYLNKGQRERARETFRRYLSEAPKAPNAAEVKTLLEKLI